MFGYRLCAFDHAARTSVSEACRVFGLHRSPYDVWKRRVDRHGLRSCVLLKLCEPAGEPVEPDASVERTERKRQLQVEALRINRSR